MLNVRREFLDICLNVTPSRRQCRRFLLSFPLELKIAYKMPQYFSQIAFFLVVQFSK